MGPRRCRHATAEARRGATAHCGLCVSASPCLEALAGKLGPSDGLNNVSSMDDAGVHKALICQGVRAAQRHELLRHRGVHGTAAPTRCVKLLSPTPQAPLRHPPPRKGGSGPCRAAETRSAKRSHAASTTSAPSRTTPSSGHTAPIHAKSSAARHRWRM